MCVGGGGGGGGGGESTHTAISPVSLQPEKLMVAMEMAELKNFCSCEAVFGPCTPPLLSPNSVVNRNFEVSKILSGLLKMFSLDC